MQDKQLKYVLISFATIIVLLEFQLFFFLYRKIYPQEFFLLNIVYVIGLFSSVFLIVRKSKYRNSKRVNNAVNSILALVFILYFFREYLNGEELKKHGVKTIGRVIEKHPTKTSYSIIAEFNCNNNNYNASLDVQAKSMYKQIHVGDSMEILYLKDFPKNNIGLNVLSKK